MAEREVFMVSFILTSFLIGCRQSWYLSGRTEFILLIYRNLMFLEGRTIYFISRWPFLDILEDLLSSCIMMEGGLKSLVINFAYSISFSFISHSYGLLSDPEVRSHPTYIKDLFCRNSFRNLTNGEPINYLFVEFLTKLKSKDCWYFTSCPNCMASPETRHPPRSLYYLGVNSIFFPS